MKNPPTFKFGHHPGSRQGLVTLLTLMVSLAALADDGDSYDTATEIEPGTWETSLASGDEDWFRFTTTSIGLVAIYSQGLTDTHMNLYDEMGTYLSISDTNSGHGYNFSEVRQLPAGTYHIRVTSGVSGAKTGDYSLTLRTQESAPLIDGPDFSGYLTLGQIDFVTIPVERSGLFEVYTTGITDTNGLLYDEAGTFKTNDLNQGADYNFHIKRDGFQAGTYLLRIEAGSSGAEAGPYLGFVLRPELAEPILDGAYTRSLAPLGNVDHYTFTMPSRGTLRVWSTGPTDTSASLYTEAGIYVAGDYNSGVDYNFSIQKTLEPGRYYLRIFAGTNGSRSGSYGLYLDLPGGSNQAAALKQALMRQLATARKQLKHAKSPAAIRKLKHKIAMLSRRIQAL